MVAWRFCWHLCHGLSAAINLPVAEAKGKRHGDNEFPATAAGYRQLRGRCSFEDGRSRGEFFLDEDIAFRDH
jgi:hypothetical protein